MRNRSLPFFILLMLCSTGCPFAAAEQDKDEVAAGLEQRRKVAELLQASYVFVGGGSGVVVSPDGLILTNDHVAGRLKQWRVRFHDGRAYQAKRIATDPIGDICLLQIQDAPKKPFTYVELGTAGDLVVGTPVLAIGNPFSLGNVDNTPTVTAGTLGTGRVVRGNYADCVQLDAPVNPGNSGGPLLNESGRLLGINGQIRTRTGMRINSGIGLAIACTQLREFLPVLQRAKTPYVHHTAIPEGLQLKQEPHGVVVSAWTTKDTAEETLFQTGDMLLEIADRPVTSLPTAMGLFASLPWTGPETRITVRVKRGSEEATLSVRTDRTRIGNPSTGLRFVRRTRQDEQGEDYQVMLVGSIIDGGAAADTDIEVGWRVDAANGQTIGSRLDLLKVLAKLDIGDELQLKLFDEELKQAHDVVIPLLPR